MDRSPPPGEFNNRTGNKRTDRGQRANVYATGVCGVVNAGPRPSSLRPATATYVPDAAAAAAAAVAPVLVVDRTFLNWFLVIHLFFFVNLPPAHPSTPVPLADVLPSAAGVTGNPEPRCTHAPCARVYARNGPSAPGDVSRTLRNQVQFRREYLREV